MATEVRRERPESDADEAPDRTQKRAVAPHGARAAQGADRRTSDADASEAPATAQRSRAPSGDWNAQNESESSDDWTPSHQREDISGDWTRAESRTATRPNRTSVRPSAFGAPRSNSRPPSSHAAAPDSQRDALPQVPAPAAELRASLDRRPPSAGTRPDAPGPARRRPEQRAAAAWPPGLGAGRERAAPSHFAPAKPARDTVRAVPSASSAGPARRGFAADIEELLPLAQGVRSLPKPPRLPALDPPAPSPLARRLPMASLGVFAVVIAASLTSLLSYRSAPHALLPRADARVGAPRLASGATDRAPSGATGGERAASRDLRGALEQASTAAEPQREMRGVEGISVPEAASAPAAKSPSEPERPQSDERDTIERNERRFSGQPERLREAILEEGPRALAAGKERLAEALFARAAELGGDRAPAAAGLAQVRLAQGDLEGAEGWLRTAIRARPRHAAYRLLYADLLERGGRGHEARVERARARSLAHLSREHRAR